MERAVAQVFLIVYGIEWHFPVELTGPVSSLVLLDHACQRAIHMNN